ncbi:hypothetical protein [Alistipes sp. ZOR0009]|uniref:hypothetical protein n=1 Tax=Alistipes sp. ZOR0009 TaxID=1339253 RepID=UPI000B0854FE|nr:hypothetical protein [Alistipes sp. ZOR0009]
MRNNAAAANSQPDMYTEQRSCCQQEDKSARAIKQQQELSLQLGVNATSKIQ